MESRLKETKNEKKNLKFYSNILLWYIRVLSGIRTGDKLV
jgi:hypothetical protein